jgi:rhamnose utilization protein RhaD (predicted bifunctional aldolase and dehydrogenase)/NAD(P)-dependent dehydrogenase (short-subunit alcohol dehydrogenase family)
MDSRWSDRDARSYLERYGPDWGEALALRVYTSHLIGGDPDLVLHGGGNTSLKGEVTTLLGQQCEALWVKGSGSVLDRIEPDGFPALDLAYLRQLRSLEALSDQQMVNQLRTHLFDASAPNPSVETLLHAFLPHHWVDHTHADAILALTNQPNGEELVREALGSRIGIVPYVMPGFNLAKAAAEVFEQDPGVEALVLMKHGLFTFGDDARTSYERTIDYVDRAERFLGLFERQPIAEPRQPTAEPRPSSEPRPSGSGPIPESRPSSSGVPPANCWPELAPTVRGLLAQPTGDPDRPWRRMLLELRTSPEIVGLLTAPECARLVQEGPLTPDHVIRTKIYPLFLPDAADDDSVSFRARLAEALAAYRSSYEAYFERESARAQRPLAKLSPNPTVLLLPGLGLVGVGPTARDAAVAADIAEHTLRIKAAAEALGRYEGLSESDLFDVEYWSLEQARLAQAAEAQLAGQVALITGGAGAMGVGIAARLLAAGAHVAMVDLDEAGLERARALFAESDATQLITVRADVADEASLKGAVATVCAHFGGLDLCVANAGIAHANPLIETSAEAFRRLQEVNTAGYFLTIREAARVMVAQGTGGNIVVNASKNVFSPGADFGAYSASKAAGHQLGKVAALELASHGIRVNMVNPDAVFGDDAAPSGLWRAVGPTRARSKGVKPEELREYYRQRNLLKAEVRAEHVGNAVVFFAANLTPTTGATLPVDGGLPDAFPR